VNTGPEAEDMEIEEKSSEWELYDLTRPLEGDCEVELLNWGHPLGKMVFWHSSAHVLGECLE
jgi:threonyl-tRNA synthetase